MLDFENRCEPAPLRRREVRRLARTGSPATCDEGKTGSFLEGSDLNEDVTASKLLSNDYIIAMISWVSVQFALLLMTNVPTPARTSFPTRGNSSPPDSRGGY